MCSGDIDPQGRALIGHLGNGAGATGADAPVRHSDRSRRVVMRPGTLLAAAALAVVVLVRRKHLSRPTIVVLLTASACLALGGSGLVDFPTIDEMVHTSTVLGGFTYAVVGAFAYVESGAFIGLVAPGELVVILGGVTAGYGTIALPGLIVVVWCCALAGDLTAYTLGRRYGRDLLLRHGAAFGITHGRLQRVEGFLEAHGAKTILVGRFIGLVRAVSPFVAGSSRMPACRFIPVAILASGVWAATFSCLGYVFWESLDSLIELVQRGSVVLAAVAGIVLLVSRLRRRTPSSADLRRQP